MMTFRKCMAEYREYFVLAKLTLKRLIRKAGATGSVADKVKPNDHEPEELHGNDLITVSYSTTQRINL